MTTIQTLEGFNRNLKINFKQVHVDPLIKMKRYDGAYTGIGPGIDKNGLPVTGLTEDHEFNGKKVVGTRKVMEKELDMAEGSLKQTSAFWVAFRVMAGTDPITLDLTIPHDLLKYLFLRAQTIVADSLKGIEESSKIEYVLYSEEQESASKVSDRKFLKDAYVLSDKLDLDTKINILAVYGIIVNANDTNTIQNKLDEKLEEDPKNFLRIVEDSNLEYLSLLTKCLDKGILTMDGGSILHGEVSVGYDKNSAADAISKDRGLQTILKAKLSGDADIIAKAMTPSKPKK